VFFPRQTGFSNRRTGASSTWLRNFHASSLMEPIGCLEIVQSFTSSFVCPPTNGDSTRQSQHDSSLHQTWDNIQQNGSVGTISSQDSDLRGASLLLNGSGVTHCPCPRYGRRTYRFRTWRGRRSIAEASMVARYGTWTGREGTPFWTWRRIPDIFSLAAPCTAGAPQYNVPLLDPTLATM
jgi:hypothetical protein